MFLDADIQIASGKDVHPVAFLRVDEVVHEFDVKEFPLENQTIVPEYVPDPFQVISALAYALVFNDFPELFRISRG